MTNQPIQIPLEVFTSDLITDDAKLFYGALIAPNKGKERDKLTAPYRSRMEALVSELEVGGFVYVHRGKTGMDIAPLVATNGQRMRYDAENNRVVVDDE